MSYNFSNEGIQVMVMSWEKVHSFFSHVTPIGASVPRGMSVQGQGTLSTLSYSVASTLCTSSNNLIIYQHCITHVCKFNEWYSAPTAPFHACAQVQRILSSTNAVRHMCANSGKFQGRYHLYQNCINHVHKFKEHYHHPAPTHTFPVTRIPSTMCVSRETSTL